MLSIGWHPVARNDGLTHAVSVKDEQGSETLIAVCTNATIASLLADRLSDPVFEPGLRKYHNEAMRRLHA